MLSHIMSQYISKIEITEHIISKQNIKGELKNKILTKSSYLQIKQHMSI